MATQEVDTVLKSGGLQDRSLTITRTFDAPRELVFDAFTDPKHLMSWWGPHGCKVVSCETDPRVSGTWCIVMRSPKVLPHFVHRYPVDRRNRDDLPGKQPTSRNAPGDKDSWIEERQRGVYREIVRPERLVFTYTFEDQTGQALHQTMVTLNFENEGGTTRLTLHQAVFDNLDARNDHVRGWTEALDHLSEYLTKA